MAHTNRYQLNVALDSFGFSFTDERHNTVAKWVGHALSVAERPLTFKEIVDRLDWCADKPLIRVVLGKMKRMNLIVIPMDKTKLYQEIESMCNDAGISLNEACRLANVDRSTVERWKTTEPKTIQIINALKTVVGKKMEVANG